MGAGDDASLLKSCVRVPQVVVYREFRGETVALNLSSGQYHGLNPTATKMLDSLVESASVDAAVDRLANELGAPRAVVERDVLALCRNLRARGLIEQVPDP